VALGPVLHDGSLKLGAGKQLQHLASLDSVNVPQVSGRGPDSVVAIETSGDWLLVVTQESPAFALPAMYACDGC
jgi:hypothetical protein